MSDYLSDYRAVLYQLGRALQMTALLSLLLSISRNHERLPLRTHGDVNWHGCGTAAQGPGPNHRCNAMNLVGPSSMDIFA